MGRIGGQYVVNPTWSQIDKNETDMEILITGTSKAIMIIEGGAREVPEDDCLKAIMIGHKEIGKVTAIIEELPQADRQQGQRTFTAAVPEASIKSKVEQISKKPLADALRTKDKGERYDKVDVARKQAIESIITADVKAKDAKAADKMEKDVKGAFELLSTI